MQKHCTARKRDVVSYAIIPWIDEIERKVLENRNIIIGIQSFAESARKVFSKFIALCNCKSKL